MKDEKKFWFIFILTVVVALVLRCQGCDLRSVANGRFITKIMVFTVGDRKCDVVNTGPDGIVSYAEADEIAVFYVNDEPITRSGLRPTVVLGYNTFFPDRGYGLPISNARATCDTATDDNGHLKIASSLSNWEPCMGYQSVGVSIGYRSRHIEVERGVGGATFSNDTCGYIYPKKLAPWNQPYSMCTYCNRHYTWGGSAVDSSHSSPGSVSSIRPSSYKTMSNKTQPEIDFMQTPQDLPETGYSLKQSVWMEQKQKDGIGWVNPVSYVFPVNYGNDPNLTVNDEVKEYSYPYMVSFMFTTADPVDILNMPLIAKVKCGVNSGIVSAKIVESDGVRHIARTGYILPLDSDCCESSETIHIRTRWADPNCLDDVLIFPCESGQGIEVECDISAGCIQYAAPYWMTDNKTLDINNDGIVNMLDLP